MTLYGLIGGFARRHWRAYVASALMLIGVAVLTVWVPRQVGQMVDGLVAGRLLGARLVIELALLVAAGVAIYFLRVGWRLQLFAAAYPARRRVAHAPVRPPDRAGAAVFPAPAAPAT